MTRYFGQVDSNYYEIDVSDGRVTEIIKSERRNNTKYLCKSNLVELCDTILEKEISK